MLFDPSGILEWIAGFIVPLFGVMFVIMGLISIFFLLKGNNNASQYEAEMKKYEIALDQYRRSLSDDETRVKKEESEKGLIDSEIQAAESRLAQSEKRLQDMYALDIVYPKYRNMVMINSICEYLTSGRCYTLDGESGAYNILESEMRLDQIILQLDQVIENLDQIRQNQYMLYSAVEQGNQKADEIAQSIKALSTKLDNLQVQERNYSQQLSKLQKTSSLTAYNTERIQKELHYMNRMKYFAGEYNGTVFNQLP